MRLPGGAQTDRLIELALAEDLPAGDVTSDAVVPPAMVGTGRFVARASTVLAGVAVARRVFELVDPEVEVSFDASDAAVSVHCWRRNEPRSTCCNGSRGSRATPASWSR